FRGNATGVDESDFAKQKIEYIHFNPISGKWDLAKNYLDYYYSSAGLFMKLVWMILGFSITFFMNRIIFRVPNSE
ncbi:MAG: hypothetical protein ABI168_09225, partial [Ginsengibacter sp.]